MTYALVQGAELHRRIRYENTILKNVDLEYYDNDDYENGAVQKAIVRLIFDERRKEIFHLSVCNVKHRQFVVICRPDQRGVIENWLNNWFAIEAVRGANAACNELGLEENISLNIRGVFFGLDVDKEFILVNTAAGEKMIRVCLQNTYDILRVNTLFRPSGEWPRFLEFKDILHGIKRR